MTRLIQNCKWFMKYNTLGIKYMTLEKQCKNEVFTRAKEILELKETIKEKNKTIKRQREEIKKYKNQIIKEKK